jgi:hypothetical protein
MCAKIYRESNKVRILHELNPMTELPIKATENGKEKLLLNGDTETKDL